MTATPAELRRAQEIGETALNRMFAAKGVLVTGEEAAAFLAGVVRGARRLHASYESDEAAAKMLIDEARLASPETFALVARDDGSADDEAEQGDASRTPKTVAGATSHLERLGAMRQAAMIGTLFRAGFDTSEIAAFAQAALDESQVVARMHVRVVEGATS